MALVFDVSADLAVFRKPYTTTSVVSFPLPPPTAVAGLLAAIVGIRHQAEKQAHYAAFWDALAGTQMAVGILRPVAWVMTAINLIKFKTPSGDMGEHIQSKHQMLRRPKYRIYVRRASFYDELKSCLQKGRCVFTPYLGVAYALADVEWIGEFEEEEIRDFPVSINTVIPAYSGLRLDVLKSRGVHKELMPFRFNRERRLEETVEIFYPEYSNPQDTPLLWVKERGEVEISMVNGEGVAWFAPW